METLQKLTSAKHSHNYLKSLNDFQTESTEKYQMESLSQEIQDHKNWDQNQMDLVTQPIQKQTTKQIPIKYMQKYHN